MDNMILELVKYRLEKSKNDFEASKILLENGLFAQSLNRSYYSIFHAVRSILAFEQFDSKKHSGIIAYFNQNFVSTGIFDKTFSKILMGAEIIRNKIMFPAIMVYTCRNSIHTTHGVLWCRRYKTAVFPLRSSNFHFLHYR